MGLTWEKVLLIIISVHGFHCLQLILLSAGCWTLTGPEKVMLYEGESLSVQCHYEKSFKQNIKFWCEGSILTLCSSLLIKSSSDSLVENDRTSIRDNKKKLYFEITMNKLKREDSGTYQCGIERGGVYNDRHYIQVTVSPGKNIFFFLTVMIEMQGCKVETFLCKWKIRKSVECSKTDEIPLMMKYWIGASVIHNSC